MKKHLNRMKEISEKYDIIPMIFIFLSILLIIAIVNGTGFHFFIEFGIPLFGIIIIMILVDIILSR